MPIIIVTTKVPSAPKGFAHTRLLSSVDMEQEMTPFTVLVRLAGSRLMYENTIRATMAVVDVRFGRQTYTVFADMADDFSPWNLVQVPIEVLQAYFPQYAFGDSWLGADQLNTYHVSYMFACAGAMRVRDEHRRQFSHELAMSHGRKRLGRDGVYGDDRPDGAHKRAATVKTYTAPKMNPMALQRPGAVDDDDTFMNPMALRRPDVAVKMETGSRTRGSASKSKPSAPVSFGTRIAREEDEEEEEEEDNFIATSFSTHIAPFTTNARNTALATAATVVHAKGRTRIAAV